MVAKSALLLLALASPAAGQTFFGRISTPHHSSSFMSSSTWVAGADGHVHQQVHEMRSEVDHNNGVHREMNSESLCQDGHCQGKVSMMTGPETSRFHRVRCSLRKMLESLTETRYRQGQQPQMMPPTRVHVAFLAPRQQATNIQAVAPASQKTPFDGVLLAASTMAFSLLLAYELKKRCRGSEARELTGLAEPFATEQEQAMPAPAKAKPVESVAAASVAASKFLNTVYKQVENKMEAEATSAYLARVYERASA